MEARGSAAFGRRLGRRNHQARAGDPLRVGEVFRLSITQSDGEKAARLWNTSDRADAM
jgi:hypothetical protein